MHKGLIFGGLLLAQLAFLSSCREKRVIEPGLYYSQPQFSLDSGQRENIRNAGIRKFYIKFFDVVWNEWQQKPLPVAMLRFDSASLRWLKQSGIEIIPVVAINNDCLEKIIPDKANALGERINFLLNDLVTAGLITTVKTVHFDCDWKPAARETWIALLNYLRILPFFQKMELSVSIRLAQTDIDIYGLPAANRSVFVTGSSGDILQHKERISSYPLPMDALIITGDRVIISRQESFNGFIITIADSIWQHPRVCSPADHHYIVQRDTLLFTYYLKKGDRIDKLTNEGFGKTGSVIGALSPLLKTNPITIIAFDAGNKSHYDTTDLNAIYGGFEFKKE